MYNVNALPSRLSAIPIRPSPRFPKNLKPPAGDDCHSAKMNASSPFPTSMKTKAPSSFPRAFSLVELLVVISVIAIIAGFAVPAVTTMIKGSQLSQGSQMVTDQLSLARTTALGRNRSVEIRFYKFGDPETPGEQVRNPETGYFRALQIFEILDNGALLPAGPIQRLPSNVIMNEGGLSTLLDKIERKPVTNPSSSDPEMPDTEVGRKYYYTSFRFLPDGSTDLPPNGTLSKTAKRPAGDSWYITVHGQNVRKGSGETDGSTTILPDNYFTLQIDPITGSTRSYRPTLLR